MRIIEVEQNSPEWYQARCGMPTSSNFDKIVVTDGKKSKQRERYLYQLAGERILGKPEESYKNEIIERGKEIENEARQLYELITGEVVVQVGFCVSNGYGTSPDGLVGKDGLVEIKCPILATHIFYLLQGTLPLDYFQQIQGQLLVTGRKWVDFMSYYPALKPLIVRVEPDVEFQKILKAELKAFCKELEETTNKLKEG